MMGLRFVAQAVERSPVRIFNHNQNIEILWGGRFTIQDFVVQNDLLLFLRV